MASVSIPYTFVNNTQNADATQVNLNFTTLRDFINSNVLQIDGTSPQMTGFLVLSSSTPTDPNHAVRKGYVDAFFPVTSANIAADTIVNADVSPTAAIAYSKLNLAASITEADIATGHKIIEVGTAAARPTTGIANGRAYYESDTNRLWVGQGAEWQFIGGDGIWVNLERTTTQSISNGATTAITWPTELNDTDNLHSGTTTLTTSGMYAINYRIEMSASAVGFGAEVQLQCGTGRVYKSAVPLPSSGSWTTNMSGGFTTLINTGTNTDVKLSVYNATGVSLSVTDAHLEIRQIGHAG
jgi:hypothetical protein